ncbi:MAG TPA: hypothetical protein VFO60_00045 [Candidatus Dormibacteraeota bacterium]|nr:hypothetical protein [Candidatus Dormibacteraeota bacterium]
MTDSADGTERVDPQAVVAEIRAEVARRRAAGDYPADLLRRLEAELMPADTAPPLEALAHLETVRPLSSTRAVAGRAAVVAKRAVRRAMAWYVRPITEDQTRFNFAAVRRIHDLEERVAALEAAGTQDAAPTDPPQPAPRRRDGG